MQNIAVYTPQLTIYWSSIVIALGALSFYALSYALFVGNKGSALAMVLFIPVSTVLAVGFGRLLHFYCHPEQYTTLREALTDYSSGSFVMPGVVLGVVLAVFVVRLLFFTRKARRMLDCVAPATALGLAVLRMSSLFNNACRGKIIIENPLLQRYPLAAPVVNNGVVTEYRLGTFFLEFLVLLVLTVVILNFFYHHRRDKLLAGCSRDGNVFLMFLTGYSAVEIVLDSTRYDSSFFTFNGFVSVVQIAAITVLVFVLVYYSIYSIRAKGFRWYHPTLWVLFLLAAGAVGVSEYLVQRHGDWYLSCYSLMSFGCLLLAIFPFILYRTVRKKA